MKYKLVSKGSKETVDTFEAHDEGVAWTYFYIKKHIPDRDDFNRLFEVLEDRKYDRDRPTRL